MPLKEQLLYVLGHIMYKDLILQHQQQKWVGWSCKGVVFVC